MSRISYRPHKMGPAARCPRQDSNLRTRLRRAVLYPLSYGGAVLDSTARTGSFARCQPPPAGQLGGVKGNGWAPRSASICVITVASDVCASSILPAKLATIGLAARSAAYCIIVLPP